MKPKIFSKSQVLTLIVLFFITFSCKKDDSPSNGASNSNPIKTGKGTPLGDVSSVSIGTTGGTIESADGNLLVTIPSGALSATTAVSIQSISNEAPLGMGMGYRLLPEGTTFNVPVKLTFHFNDNLLNGIPADFLWIVTQAGDGSWNAMLKSLVDKDAKTVTIETTHFSDWALGKFIDFTLAPPTSFVKKGQTVSLKLFGFSRDKALQDDDELAPLIPITGDGDGLTPLTPIPPIESRLVEFKVKQWTLNGTAAPVSNNSGSLTASGTNATYTAPDKRPDINPVAVTVQIESNNKEGGKAAYMVTSNIYIVESDLYLIVNVDGVAHEYFQYGLNGEVPPDPNNWAMANCGTTDNKLELYGVEYSNGSNIENSFAITFHNPSVTTRVLSGFNENGQDDAEYMVSTSKSYSIDYYKRTKKPNDVCDVESLCSKVSVTILTYEGANGIVKGYFSGSLYEYKSGSADECKTDEEHIIRGEFNLIRVN
jgi:hypothetical protein